GGVGRARRRAATSHRGGRHPVTSSGMSLMNKLTQLAKSQKGKELIGKAQSIANDPKTREKIQDAREKVEAQVDSAKHKLAEKRGEKDDAPAPAAATPDPAAEAATDTAAATTTPPSYGGDDDGPKAA
ncbi:MAG: hypothetical protein ACRDMZ_17730, partial [Solirubrobacteraceae bacterium]